jgi:hypothetical protein
MSSILQVSRFQFRPVVFHVQVQTTMMLFADWQEVLV